MVERRLAKAKVAGSIPVSRSLEMIAEARKIRVSACFLPKERVIGQNVLVKSGLKP